MTRAFGAFLCVAAIAGILPATALGAQYTAYVGCSPSASAAPSHACQIGDEPGAFFESADAAVEYEICVTFPEGEEICLEEEEAAQGVLYVNAITTDLPGNYLVDWYVEGVEVAAWTFRMEAPAPPVVIPPPIVTPLAPVLTPPSGPSLACLRASHRVKQLKAQLGAASATKAKKNLRKRLRRAKTAVKVAC